MCRLCVSSFLLVMGWAGTASADYYDDYRAANPDVYNITASTSSPVVMASETAPAQTLVLSWKGSFGEMTAAVVQAVQANTDILVVHDGTSALADFHSQMAYYGVSTAGIQYLNRANDSIWIRDYGPIPVIHPAGGEVAFVDPRYFRQRLHDDAIPHYLAEELGVTNFRMPLDFEAGNILADGRGTCFTTMGALWYNGTSETMIRQYLRDYLGCAKIFILDPLVGEGTTHVDNFLKVLDNGTLILGQYQGFQDPINQELLDETAAWLSIATAADGTAFEVVRMPMASNAGGHYRTYVGSLIVGDVNLVPIYPDHDTYEAEALSIWQSVLPNHNHVPVDSSVLITWAGWPHCIATVIPAAVRDTYQAVPTPICTSSGCYPSATGGNAGCGNVPVHGECSGDSASYCDLGAVITPAECGAGARCIWLGDDGHYGCEATSCVPDCTGRFCGSDGCSGSCGDCDPGDTCDGAGQCIPDPDTCAAAGVIPQGCCDDSRLTYCTTSDTVAEIACTDTCGWNPGTGWYDCGFSGADPTGTFPVACGCTPDCAGRVCGGDGCGGNCGPGCSPGDSCTPAGQCEPDPTGCDIEGVTFQGCCDGLISKFCKGDAVIETGCTTSCGWDAGNGWYACEFTGDDPSGTYERACPCVADCTGNVCGDDGCGGSCGDCHLTEECDATGQCVPIPTECDTTGLSYQGCCDGLNVRWCDRGTPRVRECVSSCGWDAANGWYDCELVGEDPDGNHAIDCPCTPQCAQRECGDDGCGGSCGTCAVDTSCTTAGRCEADPVACVDGTTYQGCCEGQTVRYCNQGTTVSFDCPASCGWNAADGWYDCGFTGADPSATHPLACPCAPDCTGRQCGDDGCGGSCGSCTLPDTCDGVGQCVCAPDCVGRVCGDDGCGDSCGSCTLPDTCDALGHCVCAPDCLGRVCGDDGCGDSCGSCATSETCDHTGECVATCVPDCTERQCGDDGCGGSCGTCDRGSCADGTCQDNEPEPEPDSGCACSGAPLNAVTLLAAGLLPVVCRPRRRRTR